MQLLGEFPGDIQFRGHNNHTIRFLSQTFIGDFRESLGREPVVVHHLLTDTEVAAAFTSINDTFLHLFPISLRLMLGNNTIEGV